MLEKNVSIPIVIDCCCNAASGCVIFAGGGGGGGGGLKEQRAMNAHLKASKYSHQNVLNSYKVS